MLCSQQKSHRYTHMLCKLILINFLWEISPTPPLTLGSNWRELLPMMSLKYSMAFVESKAKELGTPWWHGQPRRERKKVDFLSKFFCGCAVEVRELQVPRGACRWCTTSCTTSSCTTSEYLKFVAQSSNSACWTVSSVVHCPEIVLFGFRGSAVPVIPINPLSQLFFNLCVNRGKGSLNTNE